MKTIKQLKKQTPVFLNDFKDKESVEYEFQSKLADNQNILFASYGYENYSGDAWVLLEQDGELFEVNGGHCSCFGLETQFDLEKVELKELYNRVTNGTFGGDDYSGNQFKQELKTYLGV